MGAIRQPGPARTPDPHSWTARYRHSPTRSKPRLKNSRSDGTLPSVMTAPRSTMSSRPATGGRPRPSLRRFRVICTWTPWPPGRCNASHNNHGERHRDQGPVPLGHEGVLRQYALQIVVDGLKGLGDRLPFIVDGLAVRIEQKVGQLVSVVLRRRAARGTQEAASTPMESLRPTPAETLCVSVARVQRSSRAGEAVRYHPKPGVDGRHAVVRRPVLMGAQGPVCSSTGTRAAPMSERHPLGSGRGLR